MEEDMVPAGLMEAFASDGANGYRVRHLFGQDALAVVVAIGVIVGYVVVLAGTVLLIVGLFGTDPEAGALAGRSVGL